ncbi:MAG: YcgN family cysteine cluster protein, partial [Pseudomonadota bacterium]
ETETVHLTRLSCRLLDQNTCRCGDYDNRHTRVEDCLKITPKIVRSLSWLPSTCAYRKIANGEELSWWHPLVSGDPETVHAAGVSVRGWTRSEDTVSFEDWDRFLIHDLCDA